MEKKQIYGDNLIKPKIDIQKEANICFHIDFP